MRARLSSTLALLVHGSSYTRDNVVKATAESPQPGWCSSTTNTAVRGDRNGDASARKRVAKERHKIDKHGLPPGIELVDGDSLREWTLDIRVLDNNPIYRDQTYRLKFLFPESYPIEPPEVTFDEQPNRPIPMHPHIYSNGIICLDLLGSQGWSPVQSAESVCMSIQSMLTSNSKTNGRPETPSSSAATDSGRVTSNSYTMTTPYDIRKT
ncbi:hypothetical protein ACCO45_001321 [Purpureocillium lilacinum]|uniref:Uncharacterized protein n=1 Tax=Purpureocillium lilacinum TaxID=33203 RepID=A0ACC4E7U1_PURLI